MTAPPVFAVADGMGGHERGDVASRLAVERLALLAGTTPTRTEVLDAIRAANEVIASAGGASEERPMGTTLCGIAAPIDQQGAAVLVFNVGDSRVYRWRSGRLEQLTNDHSVVQELVDAGTITPGEAETHPERHVVTRSLGAGTPLDIDWWLLDVTPDDRFLLCSDGLVKELSPDQISAVLGRQPDPESAVEMLVDAALDAGGRDNVTTIVVEITGTQAEPTAGLLDEDTNPRGGDNRPTQERPVATAAPGTSDRAGDQP